MATLVSAYNPCYSEKAKIQTGNPNRVTVDVESSIDAGFWKNILVEVCPSKEFHFNPYYTVLNSDDRKNRIEGKSRIMRLAEEMNDWHIGCIDSDYDWILSDYREIGQAINSNGYLLQTYAYSIENLLCESSTLNDFCRETTEEAANVDVSAYVQKVSEIIYPLLMWSVYLYSKNIYDFTPTKWSEVLIGDLKETESSLAFIEQKVKGKLDELEGKFAAEIVEKERWGSSLSESKNITGKNAYLFVRGHELFNHLVNSILEPIVGNLRRQHYDGIKKLIWMKDLVVLL